VNKKVRGVLDPAATILSVGAIILNFAKSNIAPKMDVENL